MKLIYNGGPAFPVPNMFDGMSLRDYFAAKAMQAMIGKYGRESDDSGFFDDAIDEYIAKCAYIYADAMLDVRKHDPQQ